jgi:uncharacterized protein (DUF302 family)
LTEKAGPEPTVAQVKADSARRFHDFVQCCDAFTPAPTVEPRATTLPAIRIDRSAGLRAIAMLSQRHRQMKAFLLTLMMALVMSNTNASADNGLITKPSKYTVEETIEKFEAAIKAKAAGGWVVFTKIDHAAAARQSGLQMRPRTVIIFGNPKGGTPAMIKSATLAIDLPMKALVWQDEQDKVWLTYNSSAYGATYVYPRHGFATPDEAAKALDGFLADVTDRSTQ